MSSAITVQPGSKATDKIKLTTSCSLLEEMDSLAQKIRERAFGLFQKRAPWAGSDWDDWFHAESEILKPVPIEMSESDAGYTIRAEVPGFQPEELSVSSEGNSICILGKSEKKKEDKDKQVKYTEVSASELCRRIDLPGSIHPEKATASLANGVLTLELPKAAPPKKIDIKAA